MTTQHAKSNAREGDGVADHLAVLDRLRKALPTVGLNGWVHGVKALDWAIAELTALQAQQGAEPVALVETPMVDGMLGGKECAYRMDAYYFGFGCTGVDAIDRILSAVACAGKAYHHTENWNEEGTTREHLRGDSPVSWIWNAASDAADAMRALAAPATGAPR